MNFFSKITLIISIIFAPNLFSMECKRVNLSFVKRWKPAHKDLPTWTQRDSNTCYAHSAIQMFDFWRYQNEPRIFSFAMSDPIYGAILGRRYFYEHMKQNHPRPQTTLGFGWGEQVLNGIRKYGMCQSYVIQKSMDNFSKITGINSLDFNLVTQSLFEDYDGAKSVRRAKLKSWVKWTKLHGGRFHRLYKKHKGKKVFKDIACDKSYKFYNECRKFEKVYDLIVPYLRNNDYLGFMKMVFKDCMKKENTYLSSYKLPEYYWQDSSRDWKRTAKKISSVLEQRNALPMGINYCSNILEQKGYQGLTFRKGKTYVPHFRTDCDRHVSIVIGQRTRNGRCQFLVRDSHGSQCDFYDKGWDCKTPKYNSGWGIWIDAEALANNTYGLFWL